MKKLIVGLMLIASLVSNVLATDVSTTVATATITSLQQNPIKLTSLEVINNAAAAQTVYFYDCPTNVLTWTSGAYTNWTTYTTNLIVTTTNYQGVVETATNAVTVTAPKANAAATNNYRLFKTFTIAAAGTATWTPINGVYLSYGLGCTNTDTNLTVNYSYYSLTK